MQRISTTPAVCRNIGDSGGLFLAGADFFPFRWLNSVVIVAFVVNIMGGINLPEIRVICWIS